MSIVYLLFYDTNDGSREEWNTFYTPCEAFATVEARDARMKVLANEEEEYEFYRLDVEVT